MILFLNHYQPRCGVYQMGARIGRTLVDSCLGAHYCEGDINAATSALRTHPDTKFIVYNWAPQTMPWATHLVRQFPHLKHIGLVHEISAVIPNNAADMFPYRMVCDPTFPANNRTTFRSVRHVPRYSPAPSPNARFTVGSFGFAVGGKLFHHVVKLISENFVAPLIRLHITHAYYGDDSGEIAKSFARDCQAFLSGGAELEVTQGFLDEPALLDWLAQNDLNVFFYEENIGRGVSSCLDYAVAARRPIAVNGSYQFRHVHARLGSYPQTDLVALACNKFAVDQLRRDWSIDRLLSDYGAMFEVLR